MSVLPRSFAIFALCIPLAILLGVMLATPLDGTTLLFVGGCFFLLLTPVLLTHHHQILILSWSAYITVFFLPGQPYLWLLMAVVSLFFSILTRTLNRQKIRFYWPLSVVAPLVCLALIILITANLRGGFGLRAFGSEVFGGKKYIYLLGAILGCLALAARSVPEEKRQFYAGGFFLPGATAALSNMAYALGPAFYWLFLLFPTEWLMGQVGAENVTSSMVRFTGMAPTSLAICSFMMVRYGIRGILDIRHSWRFIVFSLAIAVGLFSGFRAHLVLLFLIIVTQFIVEGLHKTRYLLIVGTASLLAFALLLPFTERLPLAAQRALTFLPLKVDPVAKHDAESSLNWRLDMWRVVLDEVPEYFWLGKGYAINPMDLYLAEESLKRGIYKAYDPSLIAGDYHSGPFSIIIPFGIFGVLAFIWFLIAGARVLWRNLKYGDPAIANINRFLFALFIARFIYYVAVFGYFYGDFAIFAGLVGFSLSLNRGIRSKEQLLAEQATAAAPEEELEDQKPQAEPVPA